MKKLVSLILAMFTVSIMTLSVFAEGITPYRYEPCPRCGNPTFEVTRVGQWMQTDRVENCKHRGEGYKDILEVRTVYHHLECKNSSCGMTTEEWETQDTNWRCV